MKVNKLIMIAVASMLAVTACKKGSDELTPKETLSTDQTTIWGWKTKTNVDTTYITIVSSATLKPENFVNRYWTIGQVPVDNYSYQLWRGGDKHRVDFKFTSSTYVVTTAQMPLVYNWVYADGTTYQMKNGK